MPTITMRVTDEEYRLATSFADADHRTVSDYARRQLFESIETQLDLKEFEKARKERAKDSTTYSLAETKKRAGL